MRQGFSGCWSKQLSRTTSLRWLEGDPRNQRRRGPLDEAQRPAGHFDAFDIMSMPDKWEYPWFAAWDLAFHCVALAHVDPAFAKYQLCSCAASGSSIRTARSPRTSGTSAT